MDEATARKQRTAAEIAEEFHEAYRALAPRFGWVSDVTHTPWAMLPERNRSLMAAVVEDLIERGVVS